MMLQDYYWRATTWLGDLWWRLRERVSLQVILVSLTILVALVLGVVALLVFVLLTPVGDPDDAATLRELQGVARSLEENPQLSSLQLSEDLVRKGATVGTDAFEGTLGKFSPTGVCYGFSVRLEASYVLRGDMDGVVVGEVTPMGEDVCTPERDA